MSGYGDWEQAEYHALMMRGRDAERVALFCWTAAGLVASVLLSWGIGAKNTSLMLPVVFAAAFGYYASIYGRNQIRLIAGYVKEFVETQSGGPHWFTRLGHLEVVPGFNPSSDWVATILVNALVLTAIIFAWLFAAASARGDLMAGITTGCGVGFAVHSIAETARLRQSNPGAYWRQVRQGAAEDRPPERLTMTR
jgi:hypothetical protein